MASGSSEHHLPDCNPFLPDIVNRMLNSLGGFPENAAEVLACPTPTINIGKEFILNGHYFNLVSLLADGNFSKLYLAHGDGGVQVLKVCGSHSCSSVMRCFIRFARFLWSGKSQS